MGLLPQKFYARDAEQVARDLIGKRLVGAEIALQITEAEAYVGPHDSASHSRMGRTPRNEPMWGPPGRAYVYLCYGLHQMLNVVCGAKGWGAAILIRACEPLRGHELIRRRRGGKRGPVLLTGPGKVAAALMVDGSFNGHRLYRRGGLELHDGPAPAGLLCGPRVGIDYADPADRTRPCRFAAADSRWVSHRRQLSPAPHPTAAPGGPLSARTAEESPV